MGIDSSWIDYKRVEGHNCITKDSLSIDERSKLKSRYPAYTKEFCTNKYMPSNLDIQIKTRNGFRRIYCRGFEITINAELRKCPHYSFKKPVTTNFTLNNYVYEFASINKRVTLDAEELQLNNEFVKELQLDKIIMKINTSEFENIERLQEMVGLINHNPTLSENNEFISALLGPIEQMIGWIRSGWHWIENSLKLLIFLGLGIICILIMRILFVFI